MTSYIIAGSADQEKLTECQHLSERIKMTYQDLDFKVIIKDPKEWNFYITEICRNYGFKIKENPIVFKSNGNLIGNAEKFKEYCKQNFGINSFALPSIKEDTEINKIVSHKVFKAGKKQEHNYFTLNEKITLKLEEALKKGLLILTEGHYREVTNYGIPLFVKEEKKLRPKPSIAVNVNIKEIVEEEGPEFNPEEAAKREYNFEGNDQSPALEDPTSKDKENEEANEMDAHLENDQHEDPNNIEEEENKNYLIHPKFLPALPVEDMENNIPDEIILDNYTIENLGNDYFLALHPDPFFNGQCLLFQSCSSDGIKLLDFSKCIKPRKNNANELSQDDTSSNLNLGVLNIFEPLSILDWAKVLEITKLTNSFAVIQILPFGNKNYNNLVDNIIHILPKKYLTQANNNTFSLDDNIKIKEIPLEKYILDASKEIIFQKNSLKTKFFKNGVLPYHHLIYKFNPEEIYPTVLYKIFHEMMVYLHEQSIDVNKTGVNIVICQNYLFLAPIQKSICKYNETYDIFFSPFCYLGYIHKPILDPLWPNSVGGRSVFDDEEKIIKLMENCGNSEN